MTNAYDFVKLCLDLGARRAAQIPTARLTFSEAFRGYCEQNSCGRYGKNYTCPPHVGEIAGLIQAIQKRKTAVIWQTVHALEDSYDFEGMMRGKDIHNAMTLETADRAREHLGPDVLVLGAGGCFLCETCAVVTEEPCRSPGRAISSLEAYGIDVSKIGTVTDMKYINGADTVTYFSGLFYS
jgi:predicted metal-binding protein